jgi:uncharacterized protein YjiK
MKLKSFLPSLAFLLLAPAMELHAAPFASGNLVIHRVGSGSGSLLNTGNPVFLDEYNAAGSLVQSIALPTAVSGANKRLVSSGTATSEGLLSRSVDGQYLVLTGYDATPPVTGLAGTTAATVNRVIGRVNAAGTVDTSTALTDYANANNPRSAVSSDGSKFWLSGGNGGVRLTTLGATTSSDVSTTVTNLRQLGIAGGQLYVTTSSGSAVRLGTVGTGLPETTGQTITNLTGIPTTGSPYAFFFADLDAGVAGVDTVYIADDTNTTGIGGVRKFSLVGGTWTANGIAGAFGDAYLGLTGSVNAGTVTLYATRKGGSAAAGGGELVSIVDATGYNVAITATPTLLATAAANTAFRGVALAPVEIPQLIITEVNSNATGGDFWELTNVGVTTQSIGNWKWDDDSANPSDPAAVTIPSGTMIAPGESIVLTTAADATAFRTLWSIAPAVQVIASPTGPGLGQNDQVHLFNTAGTSVTSFSYLAAGFTLSSGSPSIGGHAGASAGGTATQSAVIDPAFGFGSGRRFMAVTGTPGSSGLSFGGGPSITLSLNFTPSSFSESATNPASTGTVSRTTSGTSDLVVTLNSSDTTEATVPATVTILANQTSATFDVTAVNDTFPDGNKSVTITASAADATTPTASLTVQDDGDVLDTSFMLTEVQSSQSATKPSTANDYWELTNISGVTKDISGYSWHDSGRSGAAAQAYKLPPSTSIAAGESVIFTATPAADFRAWWGLAPTVQVFTSVGAPGLGQNDGISFFDAGQNELFFFSYGIAGFTKEDASPSTGGHAGPSGSGSADSQALIWVPASGTTTPRYTAATGIPGNHASFTAVSPATDTGSPGNQGATIPTVSIGNAAITEGDSSTSNLALNVTRSDTATAFTVNYAVTGGSATSGTDYAVLANGTLTFPAGGAASLPINIIVNGDTDTEPDETVIVTLSNVVNTTGTTIIATANGTFTITNDDIISPMITTQPTGTTIASGYTATLSLVATGTPTPTIQWYQGSTGTTTTPVGTNSSTFTTPALTTTTDYWARVTNGGGSVDSNTATVTVTTGVTSVDLSTYVRVARYNLPEYRRTALPPGTAAHNLLCDEASGVAYNWDTDTLFICGDGGRAITQVTKTGQLVNTMSLDLNAGNPQGTEFYDPEGITYIGGGQFVFSEERERRLVKFTYAAGTTLTRAATQTVDIGTFDDNTGTEGLSYDPQTSGFIVLKEKTPIGVFQTGVDFNAGTATNGSSTTVNSTNLFDTTLLGMTDVADVFAFSNIPSMTAQPQAGNLLIIGQENARILNVDRTNGSILSTLNITSDVGNPLSAADQQHEGITMDRAGLIYVVNENGGGSIEFPQLWVYAPSTVPNAAPTAVVLNNAVNSLQENISTASPIKVGDIVVTDDGLGTNTLSLTGADAASFQITGSALYLKSGVVLDFETKTSYAVTINADDTTVGATPDATVNYTLSVTDQVVETPAPPALIITEVAPWASSNGAVGGDWFEVTNVSANAVDITGWKIDDSSNAFATSLALTGITSIAAGESVIFLESTVANQATIVDTFKTVWFGGSPPVGLQVGTYQGSGAGLSTGGDAVNLFTAGGTRHSGVSFGAADVATPFQTFDNTAAANDTAIALLSTVGVNGAFVAATSAVEIGSPGISNPGVLRVTEVAPWSSGNSPVLADWFEVTNTGARAVDITGWKVDDSSESPAAALALVGITSIAPGESVIFLESATPVTTKAAFLSNWFGASPPATLQVGSYTGGGIGLSTGGDAVNLYDTNNVRQVNVSFGLSPSVAPFTSFDNATGLNVAAITTFSSVGVNGAFIAANSANEIGSPGAMASAPIGASAVSIAAASIAEGNSGTTTLNLPVTRTNTASIFTVNYAVTGGTATAGTDYVTLAAGTLSFAFNGAASQNIAITLNGDTTIESNETIIVTLSGIVNANGTTTLGTATANGTITNDDTVPVSFPASGSLTSTVKGSIDLDAAPLTGGAEIPAFDPVSKRAFTSSNTGIQVIDLTNPAAPAFVSTIAPATLGVSGLTSNDVSSVTVRKGAGANPSVLAAAIISAPKSTPGYVVFLNAATGALLGSAQVGAVPDHIAFTPDGTKLIVANEGEIDGTAVVISTDTTLGTVSIIPVDAAGVAGTISTADFTAYDAPATITSLINAGVRIFQGGKPSTDFEPEYFAISPDGTKAMVTLQEANAVAVLDIATATFTSVKPLGKKNFASGRHDFSDRDGAGATALINPATGSPVFGLYMPDAIASFSASGQAYYVTANEGDDRNDFLTPDESTTVSNAGYDLDNTVFPNEAALKNQASLGRLTVSNAPGLRGDTDNDGDIDEILSYGGRSFSILDSTGAIVFDSGDMIENIIASQFTANFDDGRSDNKGPEPEGVTVAVIGSRTYAFVGLERSHMALVFDVTNPAAVTFTGGLARAGDLNPEGLVVVSAADSPTGKPLLLVASEVSQTLTVFELYPTTVTNVTPAIGSTSGGTSVTITGTSFAGVSAVTFGGTAATSYTVDSATQITATTPAHASGLADVTVTTPVSTGTGAGLYTFVAPEIVVHDGSHALAQELTDGQVTAVNFGGTAPNTASVRSFLIRNTSAVDLKISSIIAPSGYVTNGVPATLTPGTSYGFQVALQSATPATYSGNVVINSDDVNEAAFDFPVTGSVVAPGSAPVVNVGGDVAVPGSTGSTVLGGPVGSTLYNLIGSPAINSSGVLASAVQIRHADASLHTGMMVGQPLALIVTDTQTAPSLPGVTHFSFSPPVINEAGQIAFIGEVRGAGITKGVNSRCLFSNTSDGVLKLAAQVGMATTLGSNLKTIGNFSIGGDLVIFLGTLVDNRVVLFGWDASTGLRPLMRNGQSLNANGVTRTVKSFSILEAGNASSGHGREISVAPTGESLVTLGVAFTNGSSGVVVGSFDGTSDTGFDVTYGASQQLADTYAAPAVIPLAKWNSFRSPGFDNTGNYYGFISQMVTNTLAGVSSTNNVGVFVDTAPGVLTLQLRENDVATGTTAGVVFSDFSDLVLGGGDYEFLVKGEVRGSGVVTNVNDKGLWAQHATSGLVLVAREGSEAPGVSGSTFSRLTQIALPGTAQPIFQATMKTGTGGVTTANDTGLWVVNEAGEVKLAVREGHVISVGGTNRTVTAITALLNGTTTGGALGRRAFLEDGQLTLLLTFSGGIQANAKVVVP